MARDDGQGRYRIGERGLGGGGGGGRWRQGLARAFSGDPTQWAVPLYTAWGIRVRVHVFYILWMVFEVLGSMVRSKMGIGYIASIYGTLFVLVLLHEYGHCLTCRRVGGEADDILMWPLGGLASCRPPHEWRADLWTTIGGPAVNAALVLPLGGLVLVAGGGWESVVFNPFDLGPVMAGLPGSWWAIAAWSAYFTNWLLLAFNVLLPMYPMDGGRILHALLWRRLGHARATGMVARLGLGVAVAVFIFAVVFAQGVLMAIGLFGGLTCWMELQRLKMTGGEEQEAWRGGGGGGISAAERRAAAESRRTQEERARRAQAEREEEGEVNRLLDKIRESGMQSLTPKERKFLERATQRRRGE